MDRSRVYPLILPVYEGKEIDKILQHCELNGGFNDIYFNSNKRVTLKSSGKLFTVVERALSLNEVKAFVNYMCGDGAAEGVITGTEVDDSFDVDIPAKRNRYYRYRVNVVGYRDPREDRGLTITMRSIVPTPMTMDELNVDPVIRRNVFPRQGLIVVSGETGSGKSTLLASFIDHTGRTEGADKVILTYEAPIEYVYDHIDNPSCLILQSSVKPYGGDVTSFAKGIRNALRRSPEVLLVGESRDKETIEASIRAANTGHLCYTTTHSNSVTGTFRRMIEEFPSDIQQSIAYSLLAAMRGCITQYLAQKKGGGRVPVQEWLFFTKEIREEIQNVEFSEFYNVLDDCINKYGQTMEVAVNKLLDDDLITEEEYKHVKNGI
jgi:defect-in-organelle-trafficking protein DotB